MMNVDKTVIITGSSGGIGRALLENFCKEKFNIWACSREKNKEHSDFLNGLKKKANGFIKDLYFDFENTEDMKNAAQTIINSNEKIDGLINNAGTIHTALFQMTSVETFKKIFNINFFSQLHFTQYIIKNMIKNKSGSIVNISSTAAFDGVDGRVAYSSSKAAIVSATKVIASELAKFNIRVNAIAPGLTNTKMMNKNHSEENINKTLDKIPLKRIAEPKEIADATFFLISNKSSYITGQTLRVDGGME